MIKQTFFTTALCCIIAIHGTTQTTETDYLYRTWEQTNHTGSNEKLALVIGNSEYQYNARLAEPANNAKEIKEALALQGYDIEVGYNLGRIKLAEAIRDFSVKLKQYKSGLVFYAGHGFQIDGENYIIPIDANPMPAWDVSIQCMNVDHIFRAIDNPNIPKIVVLDACRNNPFAKNWTAAERSGDSGMTDEIRSLHNSIVIFSTAKGTKVRDDNPFSEIFSRQIRSGGCISNIIGKVSRAVRQQDPNQLIWRTGFLENQICFGASSAQSTKSTNQNNLSKDSDNDGLSDRMDDCPHERGPISNNGCPQLDRDGDGILDKQDKCPDEPGEPKLSGCPPPDIPYGMVQVTGGTFTMGCTSEQHNCGSSDEKPTREIYVSDFLIDKYEVTNAQYCDFLNEKGNQTEGGVTWLALNDVDCQIERFINRFQPKNGKENNPVIEVSWYGARAYCNWRSKNEEGKFRLISEAEWEYAARGGQKSNNTKFAGSQTMESVGWFRDNSNGETHRVGSKAPNELGLYDMSGNVSEWCGDWYGGDYYKKNENDNPNGPSTGTARVMRGGSWRNNSKNCRVSYRSLDDPNDSGNNIGFRCARAL